MAWKQIGEKLYIDTTTGAVGELRKNSGGGLFVASSTTREKYQYEKYKKRTNDAEKKYNVERDKERAIKSEPIDLANPGNKDKINEVSKYHKKYEKVFNEENDRNMTIANPQEYKGDISKLKGKHIDRGKYDPYKGTPYERKYNNLNEAIADRDSKLNRYINSKTPLEKMTRQQLAEYIVDDHISRGIVKEESRTMQVQGRLKGMGALKPESKKELYLGAKDTQLSKMSLSELRKEAQKYNIDITGLNAQKIRAKLIAIFK